MAQALVTATIFCLMLTIGVNQSWKDITSILKDPRDLARSLLAAIVLVPLLAVLLLLVADLTPATATGLAVLASAPGAPLTTLRSRMAGADVTRASSIQLTLALVAVIVTPLTLLLFDGLFDNVTERVAVTQIVGQVATVTLLPVVIGLALRRFAPGFVEVIRKPLNLLANGLFVVLVLVIVAMFVVSADLRAMLAVGWLAVAAIVIMVAGSLAVGHVLGGDSQDQRAALAIASVARNVGLAMFLANLTESGQAAVPTILTYLVVGVVISVPYAIWSKKTVGRTTG